MRKAIGLKNFKRNKPFFICFLVGFPAGLLCTFILRDLLAHWAQSFPQCIFYQRYHFFCPSCGNTRSVLTLLHGDIFLSLRYNITPIFLLVILSAFYCEVLAQFFCKRIIIIPRKISFMLVSFVGFALYFVIRNYIPWLINI